MDATVNKTAATSGDDAVDRLGQGEVERLEQLGKLATDAVRLAALEAQLALTSAGTAIFLVLAAGLGALVAMVFFTVAFAFALNALGVAWPVSLGLTAILIFSMCYIALRYAGKLAHRLTMPETRRALQPGSRL